MLHDLFKNFERETNLKYQNESDTVVFIFDQTDDVNWAKSITDVFKVYQKQNKRLEDLHFRDKTSELPLQAADIIAYRTGQVWMNQQKMKFPDKLPFLDRMILKNLPGSRFEKFKNLS